jgi:hypothetical protein
MSSSEPLIADPKAGRIMSKVNFVFKNSKVLEWFSLVHNEKSAACTFSKLKSRRFQYCRIFIFSIIVTQTDSFSKQLKLILYHSIMSSSEPLIAWKKYVEVNKSQKYWNDRA